MLAVFEDEKGDVAFSMSMCTAVEAEVCSDPTASHFAERDSVRLALVENEEGSIGSLAGMQSQSEYYSLFDDGTRTDALPSLQGTLSHAQTQVYQSCGWQPIRHVCNSECRP